MSGANYRPRMCLRYASLMLLIVSLATMLRGEVFHDCFEPIDFGPNLRHFTCTIRQFRSISIVTEWRNDSWNIQPHGGTKPTNYIAMIEDDDMLVGYHTFRDKLPVITTTKEDFYFAFSDGDSYGWIHVKAADGKLQYVDSTFVSDDFPSVPLPGPRLVEGGLFEWGNRTWTYEPTDDGFARIVDVTPAGGILEFPSKCNGVRVDEIELKIKFGGDGYDEVIIPNGVTKIGRTTFYATWIKRVVLPATLKTIEGYAFFGTDLEEVNIPCRVSSIDVAAFGSANVKSFTVDADNLWYAGHDGSLYKKDPFTLICAKQGEEIVIPNGVEGIEHQAFYYLDTRRVSIPCTVNSFDYNAFSGVPDLSMVEFREGVLSCDLQSLNSCCVRYDPKKSDYVSVPIPVLKFARSVSDITSDMSILKGVKYILCDKNDVGRVKTMTEAAGLDTANIVFGEWFDKVVPDGFEEWAGNITGFREAFCNDAQTAAFLPTGKKNANGRMMTVFDDFVAGTDPLNLNSRLKVRIEMVAGKPVVSYEPNLGDARWYTIYGSNDLIKWKAIGSDASDFRFFKCEVGLK